MGDRISVQFCQRVKHFGSNVINMEKSVVLFNHWQGIAFAEQTLKWAIDFQERMKQQRLPNFSNPITRMDPQHMMIQYIMSLSTDSIHYKYGEGFFSTACYLGKDEKDGDNSDNGHFEIWLPCDHDLRVTDRDHNIFMVSIKEEEKESQE